MPSASTFEVHLLRLHGVFGALGVGWFQLSGKGPTDFSPAAKAQEFGRQALP